MGRRTGPGCALLSRVKLRQGWAGLASTPEIGQWGAGAGMWSPATPAHVLSWAWGQVGATVSCGTSQGRHRSCSGTDAPEGPESQHSRCEATVPAPPPASPPSSSRALSKLQPVPPGPGLLL